ncbi:GNAT family N-acetyltransferase [Amphritea sp. HPY]|uniref:GNAT family N-acetyltransferase n=1 Tax=Amphritea sp. HPY TaxID=3421652 RepID=UPI003D7D14C1
MKIRAATIEDSAQVSVLMLQLGYQLTPVQTAEMIHSHQKRNDEVYVGLLDNQVRAVISLIYFDYFPGAQRLCRITALVVDESLRGQGYGTALVELARARAKARQCSSLELTTNFRRNKTHAYYEHLGFEKTSYKFVMPVPANN